MPAAAVIPAPIAYIKVAAVKKLVVGSWDLDLVGAANGVTARPSLQLLGAPLVLLIGWPGWLGMFTLKKLECSKQAYA